VAALILVTGATGSVGSNICRLAAARGVAVRALVRPGSDVEPLARCGVEPVVGDVTDRESLAAATRDVDGVIHCAAQIGGTWSTAEPRDYEAVNQWGTINVLDAAQAAGAARTVVLLSAVVGDRRVTTTEESPIAPVAPGNSPYLRTKLAAYYEGMARASRGVDVNFVVPGGVYGPTPMVERALVPTIFTGTLLMAARGELRRYLPMPIPWVLADDVAAIALLALERGRAGRRYLAMGRPDDTCSLPQFCNAFLEMAGIDHRVEEFDPSGPGAATDPEFGSMVAMLQASYPSPSHDPSRTTAELGRAPTPLGDGLRATLTWLRANHKL
jgi:nucleoside-diphosphate-sugar epimerase